jgi:hypothetical protein
MGAGAASFLAGACTGTSSFGFSTDKADPDTKNKISVD